MLSPIATTPRPKKYLPQLDGLRALAVLAVMLHHWMPKSVTRGIHFGSIGVDLFFCLSGFLITGILLRSKDYVDQGQSVGFTVRQFFLRRTVRIFPLYYLVLAMTLPALQVDGETKASLWTYTFNIYAGLTGKLEGLTSHFWSLCVEEQFYLFWPWVVLLVPRRLLAPVFVFTALTGPLVRFALFQGGAPAEAIRTLTPACFDTLGLGSLLALYVYRVGPHAALRTPVARLLLWAGLPLFATGIALQYGRRPGAELELWRVLVISLRGPFLAWLVLRGAVGFPGIAGRLLASGPLVYLGKISYGVYVYHAFAILLPGSTLHPLLRFLLWGATTLGVASVSWYAFEAPLNRLKNRFPYRRQDETLPPEQRLAA